MQLCVAVQLCAAAHTATGAKENKPPATAAPAEVLFIAPFGSKSHKTFYDGLIGAIADGGHKVIFLNRVSLIFGPPSLGLIYLLL